jgi:hypothetical protein
METFTEHTPTAPRPDVVVENHGTLFTFELRTEQARKWVREHVQDDAMFWGGALVCEHRFAHDLAEGMIGDGLVVQ